MLDNRSKYKMNWFDFSYVFLISLVTHPQSEMNCKKLYVRHCEKFSVNLTVTLLDIIRNIFKWKAYASFLDIESFV